MRFSLWAHLEAEIPQTRPMGRPSLMAIGGRCFIQDRRMPLDGQIVFSLFLTLRTLLNLPGLWRKLHAIPFGNRSRRRTPQPQAAFAMLTEAVVSRI